MAGWALKDIYNNDESEKIKKEYFLEKEKEKKKIEKTEKSEFKKEYQEAESKFFVKFFIAQKHFFELFDKSFEGTYQYALKAARQLDDKDIGKEKIKDILNKIDREWTSATVNTFEYEIDTFFNMLEYFFSEISKTNKKSDIERLVFYKTTVKNKNNIDYIMIEKNNYNLFKIRDEKFSFIVVDRLVKYLLKEGLLKEYTTKNKDFFLFEPKIPLRYKVEKINECYACKNISNFLTMNHIGAFYDFFLKSI